MVRGNRTGFATLREGSWGPPGRPQDALCAPRSRRGRESQGRQLRLRLRQIEAHVHLAVHRRRDGEVLASLLALACAPGELAEPEMAVGDEGAHAAGLCQGERLAVVGLA